jgi:hypothetical protein
VESSGRATARGSPHRDPLFGLVENNPTLLQESNTESESVRKLPAFVEVECEGKSRASRYNQKFNSFSSDTNVIMKLGNFLHCHETEL